MGLKLVLQDVRLSFPTLGEPEYFGGQKQKPTDQRRWSATVLVPANSPQHKKVNDTIVAVAKTKWPDKWAAKLKLIQPDPKGYCYRDGELKEYDGYQGMWALTAHRKENDGRPLVYDKRKHPIYHMKSGEGHAVNEIIAGQEGIIYGGCYVNIEVEIWAMASQGQGGSQGIYAGLLGIQKFRDGDSFGGASRPDEGAFGALEDGADAEGMGEEEAGLG